ncbi:molybdate ABC transporter substrate-binding protein [Williamsia sp. CHRR-6]|uniref:molybdate ABC transporter substrate-binding protein n=1 Tax=Williamsia sp. CHRR-6 TaxID=2835871 RepID=UPI001BD9A031|nr:molybdate ABC transporter substrate-binding protein [Williamsia sp. CHRR-6]MBT0567521.1 molybdate ABC transporter substrate-binding protein [Williamsia sp. CHRR-6]
MTQHSITRRTGSLAVAIACAATLAAGCSSDDTPKSTTVTVFAAASLKAGFTTIATSYEKSHPGVTVKLTFDGSSALVTQIQQGATADVIATADEKTMTKLGATAVKPKFFASNVLTIITAPGNPKKITSVADLARPGVITVLCAVAVPCGSAAAQVEKNAGVDIRPASEETSVTGVVTKVTSGQADAGLVYVSDAKTAGATIGVVNDPALAAVVNRYPIAVLANSKNTDRAKEFVAAVTGTSGQQTLTSLGFGPK